VIPQKLTPNLQILMQILSKYFFVRVVSLGY